MNLKTILFGGGLIMALILGCGGGGKVNLPSANGNNSNPGGGSATGGLTNPVCNAGNSSGDVQRPQFVRNLDGQTGWFASPLVADLNRDGHKELIAAYYDLFVFDDQGKLLFRENGNDDRVYAPHVVTDLEGDGIMDVVCGRGRYVYAFEWRNGRLQPKPGWTQPRDTSAPGFVPEVRGLAAADLDGDGNIEIVATTTQQEDEAHGGAQVFVYNSKGEDYRPAGQSFPAWPRYNNLTGEGGDADRNGAGQHGFGCYGLNVGIGNIDDDPDLEIIVTYDDHSIQAFKHTGVAINASSYFTNPLSPYLGRRLTWGQFERWFDPTLERDYLNRHIIDKPDPANGQEWLQWTASPPNVVDLNGDGHNEVVGVPNVESGDPYVTQAYAVMVLEGAYGDGSRSAIRLAGWENLPRGGAPIHVNGDYPPGGVPAAATVNIQGNTCPKIIASLNDGHMYAFDGPTQPLWSYDYRNGKTIMYASEPAIADLNQDGSPEIIFTTYGDPNVKDSGRLIILAADGQKLYDEPLPNPGYDGNGNGAPAAPTIADLDGDGQLEILVQTFDHGLDIFTVPGSADNCLLWATSRGGPLRMGAPNE
ncbi:MAG: VCBS repeat-containing protein [Desulfobacteraceae bacterium]|nr:VCBS repeat-containing protein [Desulfobacteraceae bacterium]